MASAMRTALAENRPNAARQVSIDSTASSVSASTPIARAAIPTSMHRASTESAGPQDVASAIAAAGSAEAAIQKLLNEKNSAASHNAQLWRLVEKQRSMIMDLNKDLEKSLKDKDRYRKKLKDSLVSSSSAPLLTSSRQPSDTYTNAASRQESVSPTEQQLRTAAHPVVRDVSGDNRKVSESSDAASAGPRRSDTPQDIVLPPAAEPNRSDILPLRNLQLTSTSPPLSPRTTDLEVMSPMSANLKTPTSAASPSMAMQFPGYKNASRKAPPAPLDLSPRPVKPIVNAFADASESEYEDDPDSARAEQLTRGRRKTREDDDRERELLARQEEEARSRSKKDKGSKSKSNSRPDISVQSPESPQLPDERQFQMSQPAAILRQRALTDNGLLPRHATAPALMSPGLPMSPRPGDRPLGAAVPRALKQTAINSMPMSPRAGLPLSPRPPNKAIPMPPQTPLTFASPHLARAEQYATQSLAATMNEIADRSSLNSVVPGDVYRGLVTEQYPDLLLPPNALPSIVVKTASSRMRPSRQSYIAPKQNDENPVFTIGVHQRSDGRQLWRAEKTLAALAVLDHQIKVNSGFRDRLPDKTLFVGHAPAKIDARRIALNTYFERMLDSVQDERTAIIVCKFLTTDALAAEVNENIPVIGEVQHVGSTIPPLKLRTRREGYLTKRGKNFGGWKARYFVLDGPALKYFEAPGGAQLGTIKLQNAQIGKQAPGANKDSTEDEENQFRHAFLILEPKRKDSNSLVRHVLCAESDEERDLWVDALLQYVDWQDDDVVMGGGVSIVNGPRSPRLQKSTGDLRPASSHDAQLRPADALRYDQMVAGDAPVMGGQAGRSRGTPPLQEGQHHQISSPVNAHVIQNTMEWGLKSPTTPGTKDKKRGIFNFRGRSSSDLAPQGSPGLGPDNHPFPRAVFGVPLAEAVTYAHPAGVTTELPAVVYRCLEYLNDKNAASEEGIFRLSGSNNVIKALRDRFNNEGDVNLVAEDTYYDIHAIASLLKLYLRELPASILTRELHLDFLKCLELPHRDKIASLNVMVNKLPQPNRILLETLSAFLLSIVNNADVNKMNVRNVGIVFAPTLNVPGPLITSFVEDQEDIFGEPLDNVDMPSSLPAQQSASNNDLRSPRKQMFSDLPTPAYNQTQFQSFGSMYQQPGMNDTGMIPMQPTYQMAPQGDGGFGSLNDALRSPGMQSSFGSMSGMMASKDVKSKRRESSMMIMAQHNAGKKSTLSGLDEEDDRY